ncbi:MAG: zinc metallopeptidase [Elusimicrobiota bacterium]
MPLFFWDPTFLMLIPAIIFALWAQGLVKKTYNRYAKIGSSSGLTGAMVAKKILTDNGVLDVDVEPVTGKMTDHYDPRVKKLRLSGGVHNSSSIAALSIAAHEAGHAVQHATGYAPLAFRRVIYPVASFGSGLALPLFFVGFFFVHSKFLMDLGIYFYIGALLFTVITLPVEFNASRRAVRILENGQYLKGGEMVGARKMLNAAAMTYVAATAMAVMQLLRMLVLRGKN